MPEYLSPGVYEEELESPQSIEGVSTSTAGAVGVTERGPIKGRPLLVTSFADFTLRFGSPLAEPTNAALKNKWQVLETGGHFWRFALAVKGFFDNGGQRLFVQRVTALSATSGAKQFAAGFYLDLAKPAKAGESRLKLAVGAGLTGITVGSRLQLIKVDGATSETVTVTGCDAGANEVTLAAPLVNAVAPLLWLVGVDGPALIPPSNLNPLKVSDPTKTLRFKAKSPGEWGNDVQVRVRPMIAERFSLLGQDALAGNGSARTTVAAVGATTLDLTSGTGIAANDKVTIGGTLFTLTNPVAQTTTLTFDQGLTVQAAANTAVLKKPAAPTTTLAADTLAAATTIVVPSPPAVANADVVIIAGLAFTLSNATPAGPNTQFDLDRAAPAKLDVATGVFKLAQVTTTSGLTAANSALVKVAANVLVAQDVVVLAGDLTPYTVTLAVQPTRYDAQPAAALASVTVGATVTRARLAIDPGTPKRVLLRGASRLYEDAILELDNGTQKFVSTVVSWGPDSATLADPVPAGQFYDVDVARLIEARVEARYQPDPSLPPTLEVFEGLRLNDDQTANYLATAVNDRSALVEVEVDGAWTPSLSLFPALAVSAASPVQIGGWVNLENGDDRLDTLSTDDFLGQDLGPGRRTGLYALDDVDEVSILMAPGIWARDVRAGLVEHCEALRDRFAIVDPPPADVLPLSERSNPDTIKAGLTSMFGAIYFPWLTGRDFVARRNVTLPPSGHVAGIYARSDVERGVHKAPANEEVRGIDRFEIDITKREQDLLNPRGVNALRAFPQRGNRVWGARTLASGSDSAWKYVNVRRLFNFIEESIDEAMQWVVFEPNDEKLWARVRQTVNQFLDRIWRDGMLQGVTRSEAYFIRCDRSTMQQDEIDNGKLICVIGVAPVKPAEFVIFRFQQKTLDQKA